MDRSCPRLADTATPAILLSCESAMGGHPGQRDRPRRLGAMWITLVLLLPKVLLGDVDPLHWAGWLGFGSLLLAVAVSFWLVYRRRAE